MIKSPTLAPASPVPSYTSPPPDNVHPPGAPGPSRNPQALDMFFITSTEDFLMRQANALAHQAHQVGVPVGFKYVEELEGSSREEKNEDLKRLFMRLHQEGYIDDHTQVIIYVHGSIDDGPHTQVDKNGDFSILTTELVSLIRQSATPSVPGANAGGWKGSIHIGDCGIYRAAKDLEGEGGISLLYGGRKVKSAEDTVAIYEAMVRRLAEYRKDVKNNPFPSAREFYELAASISGEKVTMVGNGQTFHTRSGFLPTPAELCRQSVMDKLERTLRAKLLHGKASNVEKITRLLGYGMPAIKAPVSLLGSAAMSRNEADEKLGLLMKSGIDINRPIDGEPMLFWAIRINDKEMVRLLLKHGANVQVKNDWQQSAISIAIDAGNLDIVAMLVDAGAALVDTGSTGTNALALAVEKGDSQLGLKLIEMVLPVLPAVPGYSWRPKTYLTYYLISRGEAARVPLLLPSPIGREEAIEVSFAIFMNEFRADFRKVEHEEKFKLFLRGFLYLMKTCSGDKLPDYFEKFLIFSGRNDGKKFLKFVLGTPGFCEQFRSDTRFLPRWLEGTAPKKTIDLVNAAIEFLSERTASSVDRVAEKISSGKSALGMAINSGDLDIVEMLVDAGADITHADSNGKTAVALAFEKNDMRLVRKFSELYFFKMPLGEKIGDVPTETVLSTLIAGSEIDTFQLLLGKSSDPTGLLGKIFSLFKHAFKKDLRKAEQESWLKPQLWRLIYETNQWAGERMPDFLADFLVYLSRHHADRYLSFILASPGFAERWGASLEHLIPRVRRTGRKEASELIDAALALKSELGVRVDPYRRQLFTPDPSGYTPIGRACRDNKLAQVKLLHEADLDAIHAYSGGPGSMLMIAAGANAADVVQWLLEMGVNPALQDAQGRSAMDYAEAGKHAEVQQLLRRYSGVPVETGGAAKLQ